MQNSAMSCHRFAWLSLALFSLCSSAIASNNSRVSSVWIFGDSLVDPGNNNYIGSLAKANYPYNGIDFRGGATGRFCNGRTVTDIICEFIGLPYPPPYLAPSTRGSKILQGVNYASGAGGILDASGANYFERLSMNQQVAYFRNTISELNFQLGPYQTTSLLHNGLFAFVIGSNDYINNYYLASTNTRFRYTIEQYNSLVVSTLRQQLTTIYKLGLRKAVVGSVGPLGCIPSQLANYRTPLCIDFINQGVLGFNKGLKTMLVDLNSELAGAMFVYAETFDFIYKLTQNPSSYGFAVGNQGCCGDGLYRGQLPCLPTSPVCPDRSRYVFWDPYHPTEAANIQLSEIIYTTAGPESSSPISIQDLVNM